MDTRTRVTLFSSLEYDLYTISSVASLLGRKEHHLDKYYRKASLNHRQSNSLFSHVFPHPSLHSTLLPFELVIRSPSLVLLIAPLILKYKPGEISLQFHSVRFHEQQMKILLEGANLAHCGDPAVFKRMSTCRKELNDLRYSDLISFFKKINGISDRHSLADKLESTRIQEILDEISITPKSEKRTLIYSAIIFVVIYYSDTASDHADEKLKSLVVQFFKDIDVKEVPKFIMKRILEWMIESKIQLCASDGLVNLNGIIDDLFRLYPEFPSIDGQLEHSIRSWRHYLHQQGGGILTPPKGNVNFDQIVEWWGRYKHLSSTLLRNPVLTNPISMISADGKITTCKVIQCFLFRFTVMLEESEFYRRARNDMKLCHRQLEPSEKLIWAALARTMASNVLYGHEIGFKALGFLFSPLGVPATPFMTGWQYLSVLLAESRVYDYIPTKLLLQRQEAIRTVIPVAPSRIKPLSVHTRSGITLILSLTAAIAIFFALFSSGVFKWCIQVMYSSDVLK